MSSSREVFGSKPVLAVPGLLAGLRLHSGTLKRFIRRAEGEFGSLLSRRAASWPAVSYGNAGAHPVPDFGSDSAAPNSRHEPVSSPSQPRGRSRGAPPPHPEWDSVLG